MTEHILNMVKNSNPEAIEKYVKHHLPSDQPSLERIYKELLQYQPEPKDIRTTKSIKRTQSVKTVRTTTKQSENAGNSSKK